MLKRLNLNFLKKSLLVSTLGFSCIHAATFSVDNDAMLGPGSFNAVITGCNAIYPGLNNYNQIIFSKSLALVYDQPTFRQKVDFNVLNETSIDVQKGLFSSTFFKKSGKGSLILNAPMHFIGDWDVADGVIKIIHPQSVEGSVLLSGSMDLSSLDVLKTQSIHFSKSGRLIFNQSGFFDTPLFVQDSGEIQTLGDLTMAQLRGSGELTLEGKHFSIINNQFAGLLKLKSGELKITENAIPSSLYIDGGTLVFNTKRSAQSVPLFLNKGKLIVDQKSLGFNHIVHIEGSDARAILNSHTMAFNDGISGSGQLFVEGPGVFVLKDKKPFNGRLSLQNLTFQIQDYVSEAFLELKGVDLFAPDKTVFNKKTDILIAGEGVRAHLGDQVIVEASLLGAHDINVFAKERMTLHEQPFFDGKWLQHSGYVDFHGYMKNLEIKQDASIKADGFIQNYNLYGTQYFNISKPSTPAIFETEKGILNGQIVLLTENTSFETGLYPLQKSTELTLNHLKILAPTVFEGELKFENNTLYYDLKNIKKVAELIDESKIDDIALGKSFDQVVYPVGSQMDDVLKTLFGLSSSNLDAFNEAIASLQPAHFSALGLEQESNFMLARSSLNNRMQELLDFPCIDDIIWNENNNVWLDPVFDYTRQKSTNDDIGYHGSTYGAFLGYDFWIHQDVHVGASVGYTFSDVKWLEQVGSGTINSGYLSGYFLYRQPHFYMNGSLSGAYSHYNAERHIYFTDSKKDASHSNHGFGYSADLEFGYRFLGKIQVQPFVRNSYIGLFQQKFTEHGAQDLDLKVKSKEFSMYRLETGIIFSQCRDFKSWTVSPELDLSFIYEKELATGKFLAEYASSGIRYNVKGMTPTRYLFSPGVSIDTVYKKLPFMIGIRYHAEIGSNFYDQRFSGHLGYSF